MLWSVSDIAAAPTDDFSVGAAARARRAAALDDWLAGMAPRLPGVALVAVGGLGRRECAPRSDLDLLLLHDGQPEVDRFASGLWYAIWDARLSLDHSVRTVTEAFALAADDVKVALGLLDARLVAGDAALADALRDGVRTRWRRSARTALPALRELTERRWASQGELAFLLEGDIKEARGGLRDHVVLRGIGFAGVADVGRPAVQAAHRVLLDVRDALHAVRGRRVDRLLAQDRSEVARLLELPDGDALLRAVTEAARTVAHASDDAWRAVDRWLPPRRGVPAWPGVPATGPRGRGANGTVPARRPVARDVVEQGGEAVLARAAISPRPDPSLALRVAAAAARAGLPIARPTLEWLARFTPPMPQPWPVEARDALLSLLGSGDALVSTWESCDRYGLVTTWLPEWSRIRSAPQHNPVHQFTIDRHLVETARHAARYAREVDRPDLIGLCALLHDIGKGLPGDHSTVGAAIAAEMAGRLGLTAPDVATVERVVRLHLLLPETATRRDLADPVTVTTVAEAVRDPVTLGLLFAIARADAAATGPAAWSSWKGRLVEELVRRVEAALDTGEVEPLPDPGFAVPARLPDVQAAAHRVVVTAEDRRGLLAAVTGCLALHRLDVVTADAACSAGVARLTCAVQARYGGEVDLAALSADLRRSVTGELDVAGRLAARDRADRRSGRFAPPRLRWQPATDAAVLELRATDSLGLLHRVATALADAGADVRAARISTLGGEVVDGFYLRGSWDDRAARAGVERAVLDAVHPTPG
jgi:[protein-PII] uridylyltransferase